MPHPLPLTLSQTQNEVSLSSSLITSRSSVLPDQKEVSSHPHTSAHSVTSLPFPLPVVFPPSYTSNKTLTNFYTPVGTWRNFFIIFVRLSKMKQTEEEEVKGGDGESEEEHRDEDVKYFEKIQMWNCMWQ